MGEERPRLQEMAVPPWKQQLVKGSKLELDCALTICFLSVKAGYRGDAGYRQLEYRIPRWMSMHA